MKNAIVYKLLFIVSIILLSLITSCRIIHNPESIKLVSTYTTRVIPTVKIGTEHKPKIEIHFNEPSPSITTTTIFQTKEYKVYNQLKGQAYSLNLSAENDLVFADELKAKAIKCSRAAQQLVDSSEMVTNRRVRKELLERAEWLDRAFIKLIAISDSVREVGRNSDAAWYSKRVEAELYVQSVDVKKYDQIMALYNVLDVQKIRTMALNDTNGMEK